MVHIAGVLAFLYLKNGVDARCPNLKSTPTNFNGTNEGEFQLFKYKSVDERVRSPFFGHEGDLRVSRLRGLEIINHCVGKTFFENVPYNSIKFTDFDNQTSKFKVEYRNNDELCNSKFKMTDTFLVDFKTNTLLSFYSCLMVVIDGSNTKFEGVLIFINFHNLNLDAEFLNKELQVLLNYTYSILQLQANITMESLKTKEESIATFDSCNDIIELKNNCTKKRFIENNKRNAALEDIFVKVLYCIGVFLIVILGAKHILILLVKKCKRSNRVSPLTGLSS